MWRGRAAEIKQAQSRAQRILDRRMRDQIQSYDERKGSRDADESLRAVRHFRFGRPRGV